MASAFIIAARYFKFLNINKKGDFKMIRFLRKLDKGNTENRFIALNSILLEFLHCLLIHPKLSGFHKKMDCIYAMKITCLLTRIFETKMTL